MLHPKDFFSSSFCHPTAVMDKLLFSNFPDLTSELKLGGWVLHAELLQVSGMAEPGNAVALLQTAVRGELSEPFEVRRLVGR